MTARLLLAAALATLLAWVGPTVMDGPSDIEAAQDVAGDVQDAITTAQAQAREARP